MPLTYILEVEIFDVWGMEFMRPFPPSNGHLFILLAVNYVSKWVEEVACSSSDAKVVTKFLHKHIFTRFDVPRVVISDEGSHFINKAVASLLAKYNIRNKISTAYHPQLKRQAEISNREIKIIMEKVVSTNRRDWAMKLDDALCAYRTTFKAPLVLQHKAFWDVKKINFDHATVREVHHLQLLELEEFRRDVYENAKIYKENTKRWHDAGIQPRQFQKGQQLLLYNSRMKLFRGNLNSKWSGPFLVSHIYPDGATKVQVSDSGREFTVNRKRLKHLYGMNVV
ncbi:protein NYNRIN-like [Momordica charantia]|uniref:Protein NYNRIN-like n=1 Tax=Momordica charantia TaxID=3673 RepID=A0A6J1DWV9_MOMCH|nr:protein NYNRIN-like [Momordica charantia]